MQSRLTRCNPICNHISLTLRHDAITSASTHSECQSQTQRQQAIRNTMQSYDARYNHIFNHNAITSLSIRDTMQSHQPQCMQKVTHRHKDAKQPETQYYNIQLSACKNDIIRYDTLLIHERVCRLRVRHDTKEPCIPPKE